MKKRVLSLFMALALCLTLLPVSPAWAKEADAPEGGITTVSEQGGTNEEENGAEGGQQNTGTPDAGGAEDSKADAPKSGEDENAGNNADAAVSAVQTMIDALPIVSELDGMTADELDAAYDDIQAAYDAYEALNAEQQAQITGADCFKALFGWFNSQTALLADAQSREHTHCVCGKTHQKIGDHGQADEKTFKPWDKTDSLPTSGAYYLTQDVTISGNVTLNENVTLCLNGQTINGKITVGSGATLTLTDCTGKGKLQGSGSGSGVTINGGTFNLYDGTITGFVNGVEIGSHNDIKTGSSFTMYGGTITSNEAVSSAGGGVFLIGTTNSNVTAPSFTMHGGTISGNTAAASDGGGGGIYVGEKCSFTMDGGTITGNTATNGNGGGIYIHMLANVTISGGEITNNTANGSGIRYGGGIYSESGVTVRNMTITGNSANAGGGIYGKGTINLTDATVTGNNQYDVYYGGTEGTNPKLTVSGSVKAGYYANYAWKLPIFVSGALNDDSVIRVGVLEGIKPNAGGSLLIAEPASGVTLRAENFKADAADCVTSLGDDGNVYLVPCTHEMDDTGYTCKKCKTQFDARVGDSAYYQTLTKAFDAARGNTVTLLRDVTLTGNCSSDTYSATLDLNGKTVSSDRYYICVGGGNKPNTLTVKDSGTGGGTQALTVKFLVYSNGTLAVDNSYTGKISRVELQAGGALERFGGEIGELVLSNAAHGSTSTGYGLKLWKGNTNACTIGGFTDNTTSKSLTVNDLLGTAYAKCELYGEKDGTWSIVDKSTKIAELTGYTAYKVQFPECVHQCADDSNPVCSVCHKKLYTKITAKAADGTTKTAYFTEDSALENGYVEAIQTLNGWSNEGCTEPTLTLLRDMYAYGTSMPLTGTLTLKGGTHTAKNVTVAKNADVTFASGSYKGATIDGTATVKEGVTFTDASVEVNGTLNAKGGTFTGNVKFNGSSIANISGGSFNNEKKYGGVTFDYNVTGTITGGTFTFADFYTTKVKLSGGTFTMIKTNGDRKLADLLAEGAAYYGASDNQAVTNDSVNTLENVKVVSHTHNGGADSKGICSICGKQMTASLTVGGKTSWYVAFATAIEAANAADGEKAITLYQNVDDTVHGKRTAYELTRGPVTLATGGKTVDGVDLIAKGISLTVTGSNGSFYVTVDGKDAELTVNDKDTELAIVTAKNGGKLSLSNGTFSRVAVKDDGSSASLSGGSYGEITSDAGYVKPYALLAKGYAYKKTKDNQWLPNANSIPSEVTVEKAPFAVEKIYPNSDTNYTGNSAFATDGSITLTAVIAPETQGVTYYYWWERFDESSKDWTTKLNDVNTATHTGGQSKTLSISNLPENSSYQYHVYVSSDNGYNCYSEPFTVTRHQHSWTYTLSEDKTIITAKCSECQQTGGSVTLKAPDESTLTYDGKGKAATLDNKLTTGATVSASDISYHMGESLTSNLPAGNYPTDAGEYKASITVGGVTASVAYTIEKATPKAENFIFAAPTSLTYDGNTKSPDIKWASGVNGMGKIGMRCYNEDGEFVLPKDAGTYTVKINVAEGTNYKAATELTAQDWKFTISRAKLTLNADDFTFKAMDELIYNGNPKTAEVTWKTAAKAMGFGAITVKYYDKDGKEVKEPKDAGTYTVKIDVAAGVGYEAQNDISSDSWTFTIAPVQQKLTFTSPAINKMYGDAAFTNPINEIGIQGTIAYTSSNANVATVDANGTVTILAASTEPVTITASTEGTDNYSSATASYTLTVAKKAITVSGIAANNKTYDGTAVATLDCSKAVFAGKLENDTLTVTATGTFADKNAGENKIVTIADLTLDGASAGNYTLAASSQQRETSASISPVRLSFITATVAEKIYDSKATATVTGVTITGLIDGETLTKGKDYTVSSTPYMDSQGNNSAEAGNGKMLSVMVTLNDSVKNYMFSDGKKSATCYLSNLTIKQATPEITAGASRTITKNGVAVDISGWASFNNTDSGAKLTYTLDGAPTGITLEDNKLKAADDASTVSTFTIKVTAEATTNYTAPAEKTITVKANDKPAPVLDSALTLTPAEITYGEPLSKIKITGTMKDGDTVVEGTFSWQLPDDTILDANTLGHSVGWKFTPKDGNAYTEVTGTATVEVEKAQQYGKVSMAGYTYGQAPSTPTLTDRTGDLNAQVTYGYAVAGSGSVQTWDISNPPALNAGTYRMFARIGATSNYYEYNAKYCEFVVAKAAPSYTKPTGLTAKYGQTLADVKLSNPEGNLDGTWSWMDSSKSVGGASTAAKKFMAKFTPTGTENYNMVENIELEVMVNKADGRNLKTVELEQKYTDASEHTYTPDWPEFPSGQVWSYNSEYSVSTGSNATLTKHDLAADGSLLTYAISGGKAGDKITITLKASCNNYEDFTITLTITLTEKDNQQALRITGGTTVVYGQTLQLGTSGGSGTGAVTYAVTNGTGEATIDATGKLTPVKVGKVKVSATKAGDASYNSVTSAEVEITITRATPTGAPKYTAITTSGKTLADAGLTVTGSTLNPNAGTLVWVDNAGNVLPGTTAVAANTTYKWLFTPTDANYTTLTGSIELYHKSSSGGGGWYYTYYTIKATAGTNGSISPSGWTSVRDGWDQTFTITPDKGYAVAKVLVDGKSVGAVKSYTFKNVTKDHTIEAIFMKSNGNPQTGVFIDVAEGSYYEEAIDWAVEKGITNGVSSNMFAPNDPCTRAQIVTFLWRAAGSPAPKSMSSFTDVPADVFYAKAVAWAVENGITSGTGESKFSPNATCTRAQSVTFLYRASGSPAVSGSAEFSDVATNAYYADAVAWAAKKGITTGIGGGLFGSDNDCTRGQIVTFLWRAMAE